MIDKHVQPQARFKLYPSEQYWRFYFRLSWHATRFDDMLHRNLVNRLKQTRSRFCMHCISCIQNNLPNPFNLSRYRLENFP